MTGKKTLELVAREGDEAEGAVVEAVATRPHFGVVRGCDELGRGANGVRWVSV